LPRVIVTPITCKGQVLGCRPEVVIGGKSGHLLLDQIRCIDESRLASKLGVIIAALWHDVLLKMLS
jgi:mRNA interferase MazF